MLTVRNKREANAIEQLALRTINRVIGANAKSTVKAAAAAAIAAGIAKRDVGVMYDKLEKLKGGKPSLRGSTNKSPGVPAAYSSSVTSAAPSTLFTRNGTRVTNRELIAGSIPGSVAWTLQGTYPLNPGMANTFPWLASMAIKYEQYRFHKLRFIFIPSKSTSISGDVILMADYNAMDPPPITETQNVNHPGSIVGSVWESHEFYCSIRDMSTLGPRKYVRATAVAGDPKTFDCGNFFISSVNEADTSSIGKLFVEYDVEFFTPQLEASTNTVTSLTSHYTVASAGYTSTFAASIPFNMVYDPLSFGPSGNSFTPPAGVYRITYNAFASDTTAEVLNVTVSFIRNGTTYASATQSADSAAVAVVGEYIPIALAYIIPFDGSQTFGVSVTMSGAIGTLVMQRSSLIVSLA